MRKIFLLLIIVLLAFIGISLPKTSIGTVITTWEQLTADSEKLSQRAEDFKEENTDNFEAKIEEVVEEYANMKDEKEKYEDKIEKIKNNQVEYNLKTYNIHYLWMEIGKYATDENVTLTMNINESETSESLNSTYKMCDLIFQGFGLYANLNSFVEKIEENEALGFYIDSFRLEPMTEDELKILKQESEYWNSFTKVEDTTLLKLTFKALEIPVNTNDLTKLSDELLDEYQEALEEEDE